MHIHFYEETKDGLTEKGEIKNNKRHGVWTGSSKLTKSTFAETYENGELVSGISIDNNKTEHPYTVLYKKPEYNGGMIAFYQFVGKNYRTPRGIEAKPGEKPKLYLAFNVDIDGKLTNIKVVKDLGYGTGEEAIRVLNKCPNWIPGIYRGIPAKAKYTLPIVIQGSTN
ncbi:energy transducer TonB [Flavobacterium flavipallidum]|uniref:Energy transducer TonB n=1 Tax=Flavobacterium flavipallidum TaxID=3139140 RepID=A0ABU9HQE9_9FLAO